MTTNPPTLHALGHYWEAQGGVNLGVVGDASHAEKGTSYHLGKSQLTATAYSRQTARDKAGLSEAASAIDLGRLNGSLDDLWAFSRWFAQQCMDHRVEYRDVREVIFWSTARSRVLGWSSLEPARWINDYGDASHKTHTHVSFYRDSEFRDKVPLFAPYFPATGDAVKSFLVPEQRTLAKIADGAWLYVDSSLAADPANISVSPSRELVLVGVFSAGVSIVAYETAAGDVDETSKAMFIHTADIVSQRVAPDVTPYTQADVDAAKAAGYADAKGRAMTAVGGI